MAPREKQTLTGDRVITGRLTVYGGVNSPDVVKNITDVATTKEQVTQLETTVQEISDEPFGPAIRSSAPAIVIKADGTVSPEEITFQGVVKPLNGDPSFYLGIFKIYKDGDLYYTTPSAVTSLTWTVDIVQSLTPGPEVYPAINLYPSFSNRLITIELYDDTGTTLKDSMNISILPSWESYIQNELSGYTPKYIGKFNAAHPSSYHNGDWWLVYDTDDTPITRGVYRAINYTPTLVDGSDAANSQFMVAALPDILWASNNSYGDLSDYAPITYISNLVANAAFISNLFAQYIKIQTGGSIRGGDRYDENGAVIDGTKPGFFIGASGACKVAGIEFEGSQGGGVQWTGMAKIGTPLSITMAYVEACTLELNMFVFFDSTLDQIRMYRWNGVTFTQVGSSLSKSAASCAMAALTNTDVAHIDSGTEELKTLRWNGSSFSFVGTALSYPDRYAEDLIALSESDVVLAGFLDTKTIKVCHWDGSAWTETFSKELPFLYSNPSMARLNGTDFVFSDSYTDYIRVMRYDGVDIYELDSVYVSGLAYHDLVAMNASDIVLVDGGNNTLSMYRWNGVEIIKLDSVGTISLTADYTSITVLNGTDFVHFDSILEVMQAYRISFCVSSPQLPPYND